MESNVKVEDALGALLKVLIDPILARINPHAEASVGEEDISKQMEAIAWLYNHFICQDFPYLEFLNWSAFCRKAVILRTRLIRFMSLPKGGQDALQNLTSTEGKVRNTCSAAEILRNSADYSKFSLSQVCICVLDAEKKKCVLILGSSTLGVWSFVEKAVNPAGLLIAKEYLSTEVMGKGKKRKSKTNQAGAGAEGIVQSSHLQPLELAFSAVKEQTGMEKSVLRVEEEFTISQCMSQPGGSTRFFIMSCREEVNLTPLVQLEKVVWVPVDDALCRAEGPFLEKITWGVLATSAVQHFRLRPFCTIIRNWLTRCTEMKKSENSGNNLPCEEPTPQNNETSLLCKNIAMQENASLSLPLTTNVKGCSLFHPMPVTAGTQNGGFFCKPHASADAKEKDLLQSTKVGSSLEQPTHVALELNSASLQDKLCGKSTALIVERSASKLKECERRELTHTMGILSDQPQGVDAMNCQNVQSVVKPPCNAESMKMGTAELQKEKLPAIIELTIDGSMNLKEKSARGLDLENGLKDEASSKGQNQCVELQTGIELEKKSISCVDGEERNGAQGHPTFPKESDSAEDSAIQEADLQVIQRKRKSLLKELANVIANYQLQTDCLYKQISECDTKIIALLKGDKANSQPSKKHFKHKCLNRKILASNSGNEQKISPIQLHEVPPDQTEVSDMCAKRKHFSQDFIHTMLNSAKELKEICIKNAWPLPSYSVFAAPNSKGETSCFGKVRLRGTDFELSETGEPCSNAKDAKESAAACMLSALYLIRARGGMP